MQKRESEMRISIKREHGDVPGWSGCGRIRMSGEVVCLDYFCATDEVVEQWGVKCQSIKECYLEMDQ